MNYDLPGDPDVYTHRSGRTGRAGKAGVSIVLVHMREDYKIRVIERLMNKRFEYKAVPGGREICEAQLVAQLERIRDMNPAGDEIEAYLPRVNELLGGLSREDLLRRFALQGIARFLDAYRGAADLNVAHPHDRPERPPRHERGPRPDGGPGGAPMDGDVLRLRVNLGARNGLTPPLLISVINRATPGPKLRVGRIRILEHDSVFEVSADSARILLPNLNGGDYNGRRVRAVVDHGPARGEVRGPGRPGGYPKRPYGPPHRH